MPPAKKKAAAAARPAAKQLPDQLREIIASRELTPYAVGQLAGVDATVIARFLSGERDVRFETAGRIASALKLRLVEVEARKKRT